jgi:endoglucanase
MAALLALGCQAAPAAAQQGSLNGELWTAYKGKFVEASGRVVDNANGNISHSEGQGYGLLLAFLADNRADFEQIWSFTKTELLVRDDGLAVWKWDPVSTPHVTDPNNASDGDLLISYALALAGAAWDRPDYVRSAAGLARAILKAVVVERGGRVLLLPGAKGFDAGERGDGPVVNPSYWIFEAFPVMALLAPSELWKRLAEDGETLVRNAAFGQRQLPGDWISLARQPKPAEGFPAEFGYNSIRIPLYLVRGGIEDRPLLDRLLRGMTKEDGGLATFDLESGKPKEPLDEPGYRFINHILACVEGGTKLPAEARSFEPEHYYPATLHLLGLAYVAEKHPACL